MYLSILKWRLFNINFSELESICTKMIGFFNDAQRSPAGGVLALTQLSCAAWVSLSGVCAVFVYYDPSWHHQFWPWSGLGFCSSHLKHSPLIVLDVNINFFLSALGFKRDFFAFVFSLFPPAVYLKSMNLESEGNFLLSFLFLMETELCSLYLQAG